MHRNMIDRAYMDMGEFVQRAALDALLSFGIATHTPWPKLQVFCLFRSIKYRAVSSWPLVAIQFSHLHECLGDLYRQHRSTAEKVGEAASCDIPYDRRFRPADQPFYPPLPRDQ